jgi:hypothetical protein
MLLQVLHCRLMYTCLTHVSVTRVEAVCHYDSTTRYGIHRALVTFNVIPFPLSLIAQTYMAARFVRVSCAINGTEARSEIIRFFSDSVIITCRSYKGSVNPITSQNPLSSS